MKESEMMENLIAGLQELPLMEFIGEYNRMLGTNLSIRDVEVDDYYVEVE